MLEQYHLSISFHSPEEYIPSHSHQNPYLSLNLGPAYLEQTSTSSALVKSGNIIMRQSDYEHRNHFPSQPGLCFNIEVLAPADPAIKRVFQEAAPSCELISLVQILSKSIHRYQTDELDCLITEMLLTDTEEKSTGRAPGWYKQVISKIQEDHRETLSLGIIADSAGIHPNYLARKFKSISGMTIGEYIRRVRLERAISSLHSRQSLTHIALESGFYDQAHFSNTFRSAFEISPRQLRKFLRG